MHKIKDKLRKNIGTLPVSMYNTQYWFDCVLWFVIINHTCSMRFFQNFLIEAIAVEVPNEHLSIQQVALQWKFIVQFLWRCLINDYGKTAARDETEV